MCHYVHNVVMDVITFLENRLTTSGLQILLHGVILIRDATSYDKSDSFAPGFLVSAVISFYGKTEIRIIPKGSRSILNIMLAKF